MTDISQGTNNSEADAYKREWKKSAKAPTPRTSHVQVSRASLRDLDGDKGSYSIYAGPPLC